MKRRMSDLLDRLDERLSEERDILDELNPQALEALSRLISADGRPVPGDRLCHQQVDGVSRTAGSWSTPGVAATVVCQIRRVLGNDSVLTVRGHGYVLGNLPKGL